MVDIYGNHAANLADPAAGAFAITPDDAVPLAQATRAIYVGSGGNLTVEMLWGGVVTFNLLPAGAMLSIRAVKVAATTAASLVGLY